MHSLIVRHQRFFKKMLTVAFLTTLLLFSTASSLYAAIDNVTLSQRLARKKLETYARSERSAMAALTVSTVLNDEIIKQILNEEWHDVLFREEQLGLLKDVLTREHARYPLIIGDSGVGKTKLVDQLIYDIVNDEVSTAVQGTVFLHVTPHGLARGQMSFGYYVDIVKAMAENLNMKIGIYLTEIQEWKNEGVYPLSVLHENAKSAGSVPIIIEGHFKDASTVLRSLPSLNALTVIVDVPSLKSDQIKAAFKKGLLKENIEAKTKIVLSDEVIDAAIDVAADYRIDTGEPQRTFMLLEDFAVQYARQLKGNKVQPTKIDLYKFIAQKTGVPVVPQNESEFVQYMEQLRQRVKKKVVGQDHIVDGLVSQFRTALMSRTRKHSVAMVMGPTGVGKTYSAEIIAEEFYGSKERMLEIDMTQFMDEHATNVLFGAPNGYVSSAENKGRICEFLDGAGRNGGVIILNEIEKAHSKVITRFMELFDKGEVMGGDGRVRYLGHSLVIMTSNKNTERLLSYDVIRGMTAAEVKKRLAQISEDDMKRAFTEKASYTQDDSQTVTQAVINRIDKFYFAAPQLSSDASVVAQLEAERFVDNYNKQYAKKIKVDESFAQTITAAYYNEENGSRHLKVAIEQSLNNAIEEFKKKFGYNTKGYVISAKLHPYKKTESYITVRSSEGEEEITLPGPRVQVDNKLLDPEFRERLKNLTKNLNNEIFGQPETVNALVAAIQSRFLKTGKQKPASGFLIGTTGTGKSQLSKSLAAHLFGRADAFGLFEMGRVNDENDLANIMSPPKGIIGSDQPGELEKFIMHHPDGGVLLFDEMSNAGGNNLSLKNSIMKQFYQMLYEGTYTNSGGQKYDLGKYVIVFTGNDGEQIFKGAGSDAMINAIYQDATSQPEKVKDLLRASGVPDALLGRLDFVSLMRPATGDNKRLIAEKMLAEWRKEITAAQPIDVEYNDNFVSEVAELMFSAKAGGRSIEHFISGVLGQAVSQQVVGLDSATWDSLIEKGRRAKIKISTHVNKPKQPFYSGDKPDKKRAVLSVELTIDGKKISSAEIDFTSKANFMVQMHINRAKMTAYHEMGHALNAFTEYTGRKVSRISIVPESIGDGMAAGVTMYDFVDKKYDNTWAVLVRHMAMSLAGSEAESMAGADVNTGRSNDVDSAGNLARKIILEHHLIPELDGASAFITKDGAILEGMPAGMKAEFEKYIKKAISEGRELARRQISENWHVIEAGAQLLLKYHELNGEDFERLLRRGEEVKRKSGQWDINKLKDAPTIPLKGIVIRAKASCSKLLSRDM